MCSAIVPQGSIMLATRLCYQNIRNQNELFCKNRYWGAMLEGLWVINVYTMRHLAMRFIFALLFYDKGIFPEGLLHMSNSTVKCQWTELTMWWHARFNVNLVFVYDSQNNNVIFNAILEYIQSY